MIGEMIFVSFLAPLLAVHIADMVLSGPWVIGGWLGAALLVFWGAWRLREEEIPRIALLSAAFFVASSMHVRLGPGSAHLLLNGLLGVVLGRRAALAIFVGIVMQAALLGHGGFSTIGINTCIMTLPALAANPLFVGLCRIPGIRRPWFRSGLVGLSSFVLIISLVNGTVLLYGKFSSATGELDTALANAWAFHPLTLLIACAIGVAAAVLERSLDHAPEFPLGLLVGELSVLATVILHCTVLIVGGSEDWQVWALIDLIVHLPIAVIEGLVVGFTVGFLARVKPQMLGWPPPVYCEAPPADFAAPSSNGVPDEAITTKEEGIRRGGSLPLLFALLAFLVFPIAPAYAHKLEAGAVLRPCGQIQVESWFEDGESAKGARVSVYRAGGQLLIEGSLNEKGIFTFLYNDLEPLTVIVKDGGHRAEARITAEALQRDALAIAVACLPPTPAPFLAASMLPRVQPAGTLPPPAPEPLVRRKTGPQIKNLAIGVGILLGVAMLAVMWRRLRGERPMPTKQAK
jgi:cobalt/nickel transport system permease protein